MKRLFLLALLLATTIGTLSAQNYIVVNSEKIFKSIEAYNTAIANLDVLAKQYQAQVDARFADIETQYSNYMTMKPSLSAAARQQREAAILVKEKEATAFQESIFSTDGTLMKKRLEMIQPIQKRVFAVIASYATEHGYDLVLDSANNATLLYNSSKVEQTQQIINALK